MPGRYRIYGLLLKSRCQCCQHRPFSLLTVSASTLQMLQQQARNRLRLLILNNRVHSAPTLQFSQKLSQPLPATQTDSSQPPEWSQQFQLPEPELDWSFLLDRSQTPLIASNILNRKGIGDIHKVISLSEQLKKEESEGMKEKLRQELITEALDIPNMSHPDTIVGDESQARIVDVVGTMKEKNFEPKNANEIGSRGLRMLRNENLSFACGPNTYYLEQDLAKLERALVRYSLDKLKTKGFELISVPDLLHAGVIDSCGFKTQSVHTQVYHLHPECLGGACLAGTGEMSLAGYFMNELMSHDQLPKKVATVSRCYRAEAGGTAVERGLYRVHHFTKVEMFGLTSSCTGTESEALLQEILAIEREIFSDLGLHFRILDMPSQELGAPAYRKFDIEAWLYGTKIWGEISSCSNCTDYQSRRLNIKYKTPTGDLKHVHTVNGTACAVPRMIMALLEQNQEKGRRLMIPPVLWPYMSGLTQFTSELKRASYTFIKTLRQVK